MRAKSLAKPVTVLLALLILGAAPSAQYPPFYPVGVLVSDGASLTVTRCDAYQCGDPFVVWAWHYLGENPGLGYYSVGATGTTTADLDRDAATRVDPLYASTNGPNHLLFFWAGTSNCLLVEGVSPAQCYAEAKAYVAHRKAAGWTVIWLTDVPRYVPGYDSESTLPASPFETGRRWLNAQILVNCRGDFGADLCLDVAGTSAFVREDSIFGDAFLTDHTHLSLQSSRVVGRFVAEGVLASGLLR